MNAIAPDVKRKKKKRIRFQKPKPLPLLEEMIKKHGLNKSRLIAQHYSRPMIGEDLSVLAFGTGFWEVIERECSKRQKAIKVFAPRRVA